MSVFAELMDSLLLPKYVNCSCFILLYSLYILNHMPTYTYKSDFQIPHTIGDIQNIFRVVKV